MLSTSTEVLLSRAAGNFTLPHNIVNGSQRQLIAFLSLNFIPAHIGLPLLVAVVLLSKRVQRHPTLVNLCLVFILTGCSSCLLFYTGHTTGPEPPKGLCLLQASLLYGMPPMTSMAAFFLIFQMWVMIKASFEGRKYDTHESTLRLWAMLIAPYVAFAIAAVVTAVYGSMHPRMISRNRRFFYCSVYSDPITNTLTIYAALFLLATIVFGVWTVVILSKRIAGLRRQGKRDLSLELNLPLRVLIFGLYIILAMSLSLVSISTPASPVPDIAIASAAPFVLVVFGTQRDILRAVCFWRREEPVAVENVHQSSLTSFDKA